MSGVHDNPDAPYLIEIHVCQDVKDYPRLLCRFVGAKADEILTHISSEPRGHFNQSEPWVQEYISALVREELGA